MLIFMCCNNGLSVCSGVIIELWYCGNVCVNLLSVEFR